jgi:REP element-mobilizing transposase RayT
VFVTLCVEGRQPVFGAVVDGEVVHSPAGRHAIARWQAIPERFPAVAIDAFVVMPDHVHGIVMTGADPDRVDPKATVGAIVRWYKAVLLADYRVGVRDEGWPPYHGTLWQRRFHDHIIRSEREFATYQRYIEGNPGRWWERMGGA